MIALSLAFDVYREANEPSEWLDDLRACVRDDETLSAALDKLVNPEVPEDVAKSEREWAEYQEELEREGREAAQNRAGLRASKQTRTSYGVLRVGSRGSSTPISIGF